MTKDKQSKALRRGNTALLAVLMDCVSQYGYVSQNKQDPMNAVYSDMGLSVWEDIFPLLVEAGMAEEVCRGGYRLRWSELEKRVAKEGKQE